MGYPALVLAGDALAAQPVAAQIFESAELPDHWARLDDFEGSEYERVVTTAQTALGELAVNVYVLRDPPDQRDNLT
jgi:gamma-glutamylcyclotransferase (GGCT)/AIG2-like uncharacterized protein YtfP